MLRHRPGDVDPAGDQRAEIGVRRQAELHVHVREPQIGVEQQRALPIRISA